MTTSIDFTRAELFEFSPRMHSQYVETLLRRKDLLQKAGILDNGRRFAHFMGQFGGETNGGTLLRESLHYTTVRAIRNAWRQRASKHTDAWIASNLLRKPIALGDWAYGGRMGNRKGTTDGYDYRGGGWLQTTGREAVDRYCTLCEIPIRSDILDDYEATLAFACAEWKQANCNRYADENDIWKISKAINTGSATSDVIPNGMEHRQLWFGKAQRIWWNAEPEEQQAAVPEAARTVDEAAPQQAEWWKALAAVLPVALKRLMAPR
jgi:putative chitinase